MNVEERARFKALLDGFEHNALRDNEIKELIELARGSKKRRFEASLETDSSPASHGQPKRKPHTVCQPKPTPRQTGKPLVLKREQMERCGVA